MIKYLSGVSFKILYDFCIHIVNACECLDDCKNWLWEENERALDVSEATLEQIIIYLSVIYILLHIKYCVTHIETLKYSVKDLQVLIYLWLLHTYNSFIKHLNKKTSKSLMCIIISQKIILTLL